MYNLLYILFLIKKIRVCSSIEAILIDTAIQFQFITLLIIKNQTWQLKLPEFLNPWQHGSVLVIREVLVVTMMMPGIE